MVGLARLLEIGLDMVVMTLPSGAAPTAYRLQTGDPTYRPAFTRTRLEEEKAGCGFLLRLGGVARCGLGSDRPRAALAKQTYHTITARWQDAAPSSARDRAAYLDAVERDTVDVSAQMHAARGEAIQR